MPRLMPRVAVRDGAPEPTTPAAHAPRGLRFVHPWAWWAWALSASAAVSLTANPLVIGLIAAAMVAVVLRRRPDTPWARSLSSSRWARSGAAAISWRLGKSPAA